MKLNLDEQVNVLFESWLFEECNDTIHTSEDHYEASHDEEYQIMFLKFVKESLLQ
jgi:predicted nuclease of predicted toxin-antitoxin system